MAIESIFNDGVFQRQKGFSLDSIGSDIVPGQSARVNANIAAHQQARQAPQPQPKSQPNIWQRIQGVNLARYGTNGLGDMKAQQQAADAGLKDQMFIRGLEKSGKISHQRAVQLSQNSLNGASNIAKQASETSQQIINPKTRSVGQAAAGVGRFLEGGTAKLANQGYQEGKQVVDTAKMQIAARTNNKQAYQNANQQSLKDYKGFKTSGGILNVGTATNEAESKRGDFKTGSRKIGGATLGAAADVLPFAKAGKLAKGAAAANKFIRGGKVVEKGVQSAQQVIGRTVAKQAAIGGSVSGISSVGSQLADKGKVSWKQVAKDTGAGTFLGGLTGGFSAKKAVRGAVNDLTKTNLYKNAATQDLINTGREANLPKKITVKDLSSEASTGKVTNIKDTSTKIPVTDRSGGAVKKQVNVKGDGFTMAPKANPQSIHLNNRIQDIRAKLNDVAQGKSNMKPNAIKTLVQERKDIGAITKGEKQFSDVYPNHPAAKAELPGKGRVLKTQAPKTVGKRVTFQDLGAKGGSGERAKTMGADVGASSEEANIAKEPKAKEAVPLNGDGNFVPKTKTQKLVSKVSNGIINPIQTAMNKGHIKFVNVVNGGLNKGATKAQAAEDHLAAVEKQHKLDGHTDHSVAAEVESGKVTTKTAQMMQDNLERLKKEQIEAGVLKPNLMRDKYFPRAASFVGSAVKRAVGLSKSTSNAKSRTQMIIKDEQGIGIKQDKYPTNADFVKGAGDMGGTAKTDMEAYREYVTNAERAIRNANLMKDLKGVAMNDGRPAVVTKVGTETGDYKGLNDGAVFLHPDAHATLDTLHQGNKSVPTLLKPVAAINSKVKHLVTYNAVVHGKNLLNGDVRERGLGAFLPRSKATEADIKEYVGSGGILFQHDVTKVMDELSKGSEKNILSRGIGKIRSASDKILFEHYGNHVAMESFVHARDKLLKNTNLTREEASKIAARSAKASIMTLGEAERSVVAKQGSRVAFFAGQYFQSTFKLASRATALGTDKTLSKAGQRAEMFAAQKQLVRGATYTFATAQAVNYNATGHPTWENHGSKVLPVFYVDKATGKEYHITNFYGQLGDLANIVTKDSTNTLYNKSAPIIRQFVQTFSNRDSLGQNISDPTASNARQIGQKLFHALGDLVTPGGVGSADVAPIVNKVTGAISSSIPKIKEAPGAPGAVNALKILGLSASAKNQDDTDKLVDKLYQGKFGSTEMSSSEKAIVQKEAVARQDIRNGNKNSANVQAVKDAMSTSKFNKFMKGGADSTTQRHFDALSTDQKLQVVNDLKPSELKDLRIDSLAKTLGSNQTAYESALQKGYSDQKISDLLKKAGYDKNKIGEIVDQAAQDTKDKAAETRANKSSTDKWSSPVLN